MNLSELRAAFRLRADDNAKPYLWSDEEVDMYLNEAQMEAAISAFLISKSIDLDLTAGQQEYEVPAYVLKTHSIAQDEVNLAFTDNGHGVITLARAPTADATVKMIAFCLPSKPMASDSDSPEVHSKHHYRMLDWALRCAYLKHDADAFDQQAADRHEALFERSFGYRHTANAQRKQRDNKPPIVRAHW